MKKFITPLALLVVITVIFGTIYGAGQYILRSSANDPQIQMAEDAAAQLDKGDTPASVITPNVDVSKSMAPFTMVYDKQGKLIASSVYNGLNPLIAVPLGVLQHADSGYHTITWQPDFNIRIASVSVSSKNYYVLSGRSLREVENREDTLLKITGLGWFISAIIVIKLYWLLTLPKTNKKSPK